MIYITGDTHADFRRFSTINFPEQYEMTKNDYVIICGDFGGVWWRESDKYYKEQKYWLDWLDDKPFTTLFVDGNHENHELLNEFQWDIYKGGKVHIVRPSVFHLMRGEMYEINGLKFFTFGGASSHDITDGIIEKDAEGRWREHIKHLNALGRYRYRINHYSWWKEELPTEDEITHANETLEKNNWECDFFISHCCSNSTQALLGCHDHDILTDYFEEIKYKLHWRKHFFGHYHDNKNLPDDEILIYEQIIQIA